MKLVVIGLQGHEENNMGSGKGLHKRTMGMPFESLQRALNEIAAFFANEMLVNQQRFSPGPESLNLAPI